MNQTYISNRLTPAQLLALKKENMKLSPEEQAAFVAIYSLLVPVIVKMGKAARGEYLAASEALATFKEGKIDEISCIHLLAKSGFTEIKSKQALFEMWIGEDGQVAVNDFWKMLRLWANIPLFNSLLSNKEWQEEAQIAAIEYWQELKELQEGKEGSKRADRIAQLLEIASKREWNHEESAWFMETCTEMELEKFVEVDTRRKETARVKEVKKAPGLATAADF